MSEQEPRADSKVPHKTRRTRKIVGVGLLVLLSGLGLLFVGFSWLTGMPVYARPRTAQFTRVTSSVDRFRYQPERIQVGEVYHYRKSNLDGSKPADVSLYVASLERIEVFKVYPSASSTVLVRACMDWGRFSIAAIESYDIHADSSRTLVADGRLTGDDRFEFHIAQLLWVKDHRSFAPVGHYPVHNYNFDLASLNFAFRHLIDPSSDFEIGVQMPCFDLAHLGRLEYRGQATLRFQGEDSCHDRKCRKYQIGGEAFDGRHGFLWVNFDGGYFEKVEIPIRDNPGWKDFKLELTTTESMSEAAWRDFIERETTTFFGTYYDGSR